MDENMLMHNHHDAEQRSETCPTCALIDITDRPAASQPEAIEPAEPESATAGRPAVGEPGPPERSYMMPEEPEEPEEAPEPTKLPVVKKRVAVGEVGMVPLDEILDDVNDNVARGCETIVLDTPKMRRFVASLKTGQQHPVLARPIPGDGPKRYRLIFGFRRVAGARFLGWQEIEVKVVDATDEEALLRNWAEGSRENADSFTLAVGITDAVERGISTERIAEHLGVKQDRVDILVKIMTKCPEELIEMFHMDCSQRMIDMLYDIATINADSPEELRDLQLQHWGEAREREAAKAQALEEAKLLREQRKNGGRKKHERRMISFIAVGQIGARVAEATEWYDSEAKRYNPISEEVKSFLNEFVKSIRRGTKITVR